MTANASPKDAALNLALEALETVWYHVGTFCPTDEAIELYDDARAAIKEVLAQPEQEPVAWATREDFYRELNGSIERVRKEMEVKSVTMRCKDYDLVLPIIDTHFGRVLVGQVSIPPQRKPLPPKSPCEMTQAEGKMFKLGWLECEAAHGIKEKNT